MIGALIGLLSIVAMIVGFIGPVIAGVWLGVLGEWGLIAAGVGYMFSGVLLISLLILPGFVFMAGAGALHERGHTFMAVVTAIPTLLWTYAVALGTCVIVFMYAVDQIPYGENEFPYLLWALCIATAPWSYMAAKEQQSDASSYAGITAFYLFIGCAVAAFWYSAEGADGWIDWAVRIGVVLCVGLVMQLLMVIAETLSRPRW